MGFEVSQLELRVPRGAIFHPSSIHLPCHSLPLCVGAIVPILKPILKDLKTSAYIRNHPELLRPISRGTAGSPVFPFWCLRLRTSHWPWSRHKHNSRRFPFSSLIVGVVVLNMFECSCRHASLVVNRLMNLVVYLPMPPSRFCPPPSEA